MGSAMAHRLLDAGHALKVWNRTPAKAEALVARGAQWCESPAAAATDVDGVLMCLFDAASAEAVVFGPQGIAQVRGLPWLADHASIAPDATRSMALRLQQAHGAAWLDAPVSGGIAGVQAASLAVMVGGDPAHLPALKQAIAAYASNITHMGASGAGQATKLCNQVIVASTVAAIAEALGFAQRNGIATDQLATALRGGWADSKPLQVFAPRMLHAQAQSIGALSTMLKDVDTVMQTAQTSGAPMPVMACVQQLLRTAEAQGLGEAELSALISVVLPEQREAFLAQARRLDSTI